MLGGEQLHKDFGLGAEYTENTNNRETTLATSGSSGAQVSFR
jgi:hypothetical protein